MINFKKASGIAALLHAFAYLTGIALYATVLNPVLNAEPEEYLALLGSYKSLMYWWIFICYLAAGFCLIPVAWAVRNELKSPFPDLALITAVLAFIWAGLIIGSGNLMMYGFGELLTLHRSHPEQAQIVAAALPIVEDGLISSNEVIGGLWSFLLSFAALKAGKLNRALGYTGLVIGAAGILSVAPPLNEAGVMIFGIGMIIWFIMLGVHFLRGPRYYELPGHGEEK